MSREADVAREVLTEKVENLGDFVRDIADLVPRNVDSFYRFHFYRIRTVTRDAIAAECSISAEWSRWRSGDNKDRADVLFLFVPAQRKTYRGIVKTNPLTRLCHFQFADAFEKTGKKGPANLHGEN